jgi:Tfp pilus assembly protein PilO
MDKSTGGSSRKFSVIALLFFVCALAGFVFYVKPAWDETGSLAKGRDDKAAQKQELQTKLTDLQKIQEQLNSVSEVSRQTSLSAIPEKLEEDALILDITGIAQKNDIVLSSISFSAPTDARAGEVAKATINASLTGTEGDLVKFLKGIETSSRKLLVKSVTVQLASQEAGSNLAGFNVSMEAYFQGMI